MSIKFKNYIYCEKLEKEPENKNLELYIKNYVLDMSSNSYLLDEVECIEKYQINRQDKNSYSFKRKGFNNLSAIYFERVIDTKKDQNMGKVCFAFGNKIRDNFIFDGYRAFAPEEKLLLIFPNWIDVAFYPLAENQELIMNIYEFNAKVKKNEDS